MWHVNLYFHYKIRFCFALCLFKKLRIYVLFELTDSVAKFVIAMYWIARINTLYKIFQYEMTEKDRITGNIICLRICDIYISLPNYYIFYITSAESIFERRE